MLYLFLRLTVVSIACFALAVLLKILEIEQYNRIITLLWLCLSIGAIFIFSGGRKEIQKMSKPKKFVLLSLYCGIFYMGIFILNLNRNMIDVIEFVYPFIVILILVSKPKEQKEA